MAPSVLTPKEKAVPARKSVPYRGPAELVDAIDREAKKMGLSRNEAMTQFLQFALEEHQKDGGKRTRK